MNLIICNNVLRFGGTPIHEVKIYDLDQPVNFSYNCDFCKVGDDLNALREEAENFVAEKNKIQESKKRPNYISELSKGDKVYLLIDNRFIECVVENVCEYEEEEINYDRYGEETGSVYHKMLKITSKDDNGYEHISIFSKNITVSKHLTYLLDTGKFGELYVDKKEALLACSVLFKNNIEMFRKFIAEETAHLEEAESYLQELENMMKEDES